jgi:hypothetical protein
MRGLLALVVCAVLLSAQRSSSLPPWLVVYPGADAETNSLPEKTEVTYHTSAPVAGVIEHYREVFSAADVAFQPRMFGSSAIVNSVAPGRNLTIQIEKRRDSTFVRVTCTPRPDIPHYSEADAIHKMEKYDQPVYPKPRPPMPPLTWPEWLRQYDGTPTPIERGVDRFKLNYLRIEFTSSGDRAEIQKYYSDLLNAHDFPVTIESPSITPAVRPVIVEGTHRFGDPGPRFVAHVEITPMNGKFRVEVRITAHQ